MRRSIYRELATSLLADCRDIVASFADSTHNHGVFAFAIDCEPFHGLVDVCINTRDGFSRVTSEKFPNASPLDLEGLHGPRFTPEQFPFREFTLSEETLQRLDEIAAVQHDAKTDRTAERHAELFMRTLVRVLLMLDPDLEKLDLTDDFLAYVHERGASEKKTIGHMRQTMSQEQFDRAFPEIKQFEERLSSLQNEAPEARATFWSEALRDLILERGTPTARRMRHTGITYLDARQALIELGSASVPPLLDQLAEIANLPQAPRKTAKASRRNMPSETEARLTTELMNLMRTIQLVDEHSVGRLQTMASTLQAQTMQSGNPAPTFAELVSLLHALRPHRFPPPKLDADGRAVANALEFLAPASSSKNPAPRERGPRSRAVQS